jgi:hypothetical protein
MKRSMPQICFQFDLSMRPSKSLAANPPTFNGVGVGAEHAEAAGVARQLGNILIDASDSVLAHQTLEEMLRLANSTHPQDQLAAGLIVESPQVVEELSVLANTACVAAQRLRESEELALEHHVGL